MFRSFQLIATLISELVPAQPGNIDMEVQVKEWIGNFNRSFITFKQNTRENGKVVMMLEEQFFYIIFSVRHFDVK